MPVVEGRIWNAPIIYYKEARLLLEYLHWKRRTINNTIYL